jgi:hypothetical protein
MPRIRGSEDTIKVLVDGKLQKGSFARVESFKHTPRIDFSDGDFVGEKFSEPDYQMHGHEINFVVHEEDTACQDLLEDIATREEQGLPPPKITIVRRKTYRDGVTPPLVESYERLLLKPDDNTNGGRKDYVKWAWTGRCKRKRRLPST